MSTVIMAGILLIPTNIHDAKANPCQDATSTVTRQDGGNGGQKLVLLELVEMVEIRRRLSWWNWWIPGSAGAGADGGVEQVT